MAKSFVLRVMGESDILEVKIDEARMAAHQPADHDASWERADKANWLAHWLDGDRAFLLYTYPIPRDIIPYRE